MVLRWTTYWGRILWTRHTWWAGALNTPGSCTTEARRSRPSMSIPPRWAATTVSPRTTHQPIQTRTHTWGRSWEGPTRTTSSVIWDRTTHTRSLRRTWTQRLQGRWLLCFLEPKKSAWGRRRWVTPHEIYVNHRNHWDITTAKTSVNSNKLWMKAHKSCEIIHLEKDIFTVTIIDLVTPVG